MDRGTAALVRTRRTHTRGAAGVRTGDEVLPQQGELDALHRRFEVLRERMYRARPQITTQKYEEFLVVWNEWLPFYTNPSTRGQYGPFVLERLYRFQQQAIEWENFIYKAENGGPSLWPYALGAAALLGAVVYATRPKTHG